MREATWLNACVDLARTTWHASNRLLVEACPGTIGVLLFTVIVHLVLSQRFALYSKHTSHELNDREIL